MTVEQQAERLIDLGVADLAGVGEHDVRREAAALPTDGLLVVGPRWVPAARLAPLLERGGKPGFVVEDMVDLGEFVPVPEAPVPDRPLYVMRGVERGDDMQNWSPAEAMPAIVGQRRRPLTVNEGISWLLQDPEALAPNRCFMTIGSRKPKAAGGLDARTPALWISGGTGRDGRERKGAPKVGWCWHNNRHTWLGFASCAEVVG